MQGGTVLSPGVAGSQLRIGRGNANGGIINERDGVSLALNSSGLHDEYFGRRGRRGTTSQSARAVDSSQIPKRERGDPFLPSPSLSSYTRVAF